MLNQAVILADRIGPELGPLTSRFCPATLPVANIPTLQFTLESLLKSGITDFIIAVSTKGSEIRSLFGDGSFWGVSISYIVTKGEEDPALALSKRRSDLRFPLVVARGDIYRSGVIDEFFEWCQVQNIPGAYATCAGENCGLVYLTSPADDSSPAAWPLPEPPADPQLAGNNVFDVPRGTMDLLITLKSYHQTCISLSATIKRPELRMPDRTTPGVRAERLAKLSRRASVSGDVLIGESTQISDLAQIAGPAVIGSGCLVDRSASITNCVILPGTYIGESLALVNAIVDGNHVIRVDRNTTIEIADPFITSHIGAELQAKSTATVDRIAGAILLMLSLPLWPIALALGLSRSVREPLKRVRLRGLASGAEGLLEPEETVEGYQFCTDIPVLRDLPLIWLTVAGKLRLFGIRPPLLEAGLPGGEQTVESFRRPGLFGPRELLQLDQASPDEIALYETEFIERAGPRAFVQRAAAGLVRLLSSQVWTIARKSSGAE